jgi:precorrin-6B methylase 2
VSLLRSALLLLAACQPRAQVEPASHEPEPTPDAAEHGVAPEPTPAAEAEEQPNARAVEINRDYAKRTDAKVWARSFEREGREAHDHKREIVAALALQPGSSVADVGAGTGLFTFDFAKAVGRSGTVYAVDVHDYFLRHIEAKAAKRRVQNVKVVAATQKSANLPDASVDVVFMCDAYHHVEYPKTYLASLRAALRPEGRLVVIDYEAIPGVSERWIVDHVRATPEQFKAEIVSAGFAFVRAHDVLDENFFFEFTRTADP